MPVSRKKRLLATLAAIPLGVAVGFVVGLILIGAPHAFPGVLLDASDSVRNTVHLGAMAVTPIVFAAIIWFGPLEEKVSGRPRASDIVTSTDIATPDLAEAFRKKPTQELEALVRTKPQGVYPARTYQLAEEVLRERNASEPT